MHTTSYHDDDENINTNDKNNYSFNNDTNYDDKVKYTRQQIEEGHVCPSNAQPCGRQITWDICKQFLFTSANTHREYFQNTGILETTGCTYPTTRRASLFMLRLFVSLFLYILLVISRLWTY